MEFKTNKFIYFPLGVLNIDLKNASICSSSLHIPRQEPHANMGTPENIHASGTGAGQKDGSSNFWHYALLPRISGLPLE